jgi:hypothetical protein
LLFFLVSFILLYFLPEQAFAFGPLVHLKLAEEILRERHFFPDFVRIALSASPLAYLYGSFLADLILGKSFFVSDREHSHSWEVGFQLLEKAESLEQKSFALGYLSHLAADTVAHNYFVPVLLLLRRKRFSRGHLSWELLYDRTVLPIFCQRLHLLLHHPARWIHLKFLQRHLKATLFSHPVNSFLFSSQIRLQNRYQRIRLVREIGRHEFPIPPLFSSRSERLARSAIYGLLRDPFHSPLLSLDPRGRESILRVKRISRNLSRKNAPLTLTQAHEAFFCVFTERIPFKESLDPAKAPLQRFDGAPS